MRHCILLLTSCFILNTNVHCFGQGLPIKPTRTISFTTDEGSYMDVDISRDGKELLFDLLGDIYAVPAAGGEARQLTRGLALNLHPVWSPDGKKIACVSDYSGSFHINVLSVDGGLHAVLGDPAQHVDYGSGLTWSPDGNFVIGEDSVYGLGGRKEAIGGEFEKFLRFSADGKTLYGIDSGRVCNYDPATQGKKVVAEPSDLRAFECRNLMLSPDGRFLSYVVNLNKNRALVVSDLATGQRRVLVASLELTPQFNPEFSGGVPLPRFCFSPDSKNIFIGYAGKIHKIDVENGNDKIIPFRANVKADLGPLNYNTYRVNYDPVKIKYIRHASVSPDGKYLVFSALDKIYIMDLPKGKPRILADQALNQFEPSFSPDGQWVAYVSWNDTAGGYLWRVPAAGGEPERLTSSAGYCRNPTWSPGGNDIALLWSRVQDRDAHGPAGQIQTIDLNTGHRQLIEDSVPVLNSLAFSPDGKRILYTPGKDPAPGGQLKAQLVSRDLDGNNRKMIAAGTSLTSDRQKFLSPDGRFIVYSLTEDLYLVPVYSGTSPSTISNYFERRSVIRFAAGIDPYWEKGGRVLAWTYGNKLYRITVDKIMDAAEKEMPSQPSFWSHPFNFVDVKVAPDEVIAPDIVVPYYRAHGRVALKNARILTMKGREVIENGTIVIKDGRIEAIGQARSIAIPAGTKVFDVAGTTIMPGLIDLHLHLFVPKDILPQQSWMFLVNLAYGVTTARDPSQSLDGFGYADLLKTGQMIGPRLFTVGTAVVANNGIVRVDNQEDLRKAVQKRATLGAIVVKNYLDPTTRLPRQWLAMACREAGLNMTNEGYYVPIYQWGMLKDGSSGIEHNPEWGDVYKDVITLYARSGSWFTPTLQVTGQGFVSHMAKEYFKFKYWHMPDEKLRRFTISDPKGVMGMGGTESIELIERSKSQDSLFPSLLASSVIDARIRQLGGKVTLGSHGNTGGIATHNELWALQLGGLTNMEALQAATIMGAEGLGVQKDLGSLEVGKIADLIILNKNPLDDIHNSREIRYVMKDGILYNGDTLDELWPKQKKCPEWKLKTSQ